MIVIEEHADVTLMRKLESLRHVEKTPRAIELRYSEVDAELRPSPTELLEAAEHAFPEAAGDAQMFVLGDGDVVILLEQASGKQLREFRALLPLGSEFVLKFYEFRYDLNQVLVRVQQKLDQAREKAQRDRAEAQRLMQLKKRTQILSFTPSTIEVERIRKARQGRGTPELLIIEDDVFSRRLLENILPKRMHVTSVGEPDEALQRYALVVPDVVFLDINLPDVNGHELLDKILAIDPDAYVVMISGNSDRENVIRAMSHGARGFIAKPFSRDRVNDYLSRCPTIVLEVPHAHS